MLAEHEREMRRRRSQRFPHAVSVTLSSTEPGGEFEESCKTKDVSSHGCLVRSPRKLTAGQLLELKIVESGRRDRVRVARVRPDLTAMLWEVGLELLEPGNIWDFEFLPQMLHWPADLPAPPIELARPPTEAKERPPMPPGIPGKELEERSFEIVNQVTSQITKNAQYALNTVEESLREMAESVREDLRQWTREQRARLELEMKQGADSWQTAAFRAALEEIRRQDRAVIESQLEDFRSRLDRALRASLQTLLDHLQKPK